MVLMKIEERQLSLLYFKYYSGQIYRPVSLTSVISKMMELLIRNQIVAHLQRHDLLADDQHGFVPSRNCMTQLLLRYRNGQKSSQFWHDTHRHKAFDSVSHDRYLPYWRILVDGNLVMRISHNSHNKWDSTRLSARTNYLRSIYKRFAFGNQPKFV